MMSAPVLAALALLVVGTSFLSGVFGMAGGLILLGVLLLLMDVAPAMILFGVTQLGANGWRAVLWRKRVVWRLIGGYAIGSLATFALLKAVAFLPDKAMVYICLGLLPIAAELLPESWRPDITRRFMPVVCGAFIMAMQLMAGGAGSVLDLFFQRSGLDRREIVATKAVTQVLTHVCRIVYFGSFVDAGDGVLPLWIYAGAIAMALIGTTWAASTLTRMSEAGFRTWSRRIILAISVSFLVRGFWLLYAG